MGYITLNKSNLISNFNYFAKLSGGADKVMVGLKDNAYGHGLMPIAQLLSKAGAKHAFVRSLQEAKEISPFFESILILIEVPSESLPKNICTVIPEIISISKIPRGNTVELAIDTGMHREGIAPSEVKKALDLIEDRGLLLNGVFTHFATSNSKSNKLYKQKHIFDSCIEKIKNVYKKPFRIHCANTGATARVKPSKYDIIRVGIGLYGYSDCINIQSKLRSVLSLYARRISTRSLDLGESIGYGDRIFVVPNDNFIVSNYDIGYGDGFLRLNERKKGQISDGRQILGRVSMDSLSVEGSNEEICVFDDAKYLAQIHDTITYEILTSLKPNIERIIV